MKKVLLVACNSQYIHSNPALFALRRAAEQAGCADMVDAVDFSINMPVLRIEEDIYRQRPDVLAFSVYIWNSEFLLPIVRDLKKLLPQTAVLLGGPEPSARPADYFRDWPADGVWIGEGEISFAAFLTALRRGEERPRTPGLLWRDGAADYRPVERADLSTLPFLYTTAEIADLRERHKIVYYESSRGCPFHCSFCASANEPLRERPLELVLAELPRLAECGGQVKFIDRTFNAARRRACAITEAVLALYRPGLSWHFEISPFSLPDELVELWLAAPPDYLKLEMGVQTLNPAALRAICRRGDWDAAEPTVKRLIAAGNTHLHLDLIAGLPGDTPRQFAASFHRLHQLDTDYLQFGFLKILPGSPLAAEAADRGLVYEQQPPYRVLATPDMDAAWMFTLNRAERMFNALYNKSREFRPALLAAAERCGDALALYQRAAELYPGVGGLSQQDKIALTAALSDEAGTEIPLAD